MKVFITGTNRGLGLEFVKQYLKRGDQVLATYRNPSNIKHLHTILNSHEDLLSLIQLDVASYESCNHAYREVKSYFDSIDIFINNAGIASGGSATSYTLGGLHTEDIEKVFRINAIAPVLLVEKFLDLIERGNSPRIINITSGLSSITRKNLVFRYSYCASKTALNMFSKLLSLELRDKGIIVIPLHPGHVKTDLGGPYAPLVPKQSISGMIKVIDSLTLEDSGKFFDWQGQELPW